MSLWDKIITQNKIESALISDLNDLSYKSTKGRREKPRDFNQNMVNLGTLPFKENPPPDKITKEMIEEYHKSMTGPIKDPITGAILANKYNPSAITLDIADLSVPPPLIDFGGVGRPANETDIQAFKDNLKQYIEVDLPKLEAEFLRSENDIKILKELINKGVAKKHPKTGKITYTALSPGKKAQAQADVARDEARMKMIETDINNIHTNLIPNENKLIKDALNNIAENKQITINHNKNLKQKKVYWI